MSAVGDLSITVRKIAEDVKNLKAAYEAKNDAQCNALLAEVKRHIIMFPTFLSPSASSSTRGGELSLARDYLELGVLATAHQKDLASFEVYFSQLQVYYSDIGTDELPESPQFLMLLGLNLIRLLVCSRIAEFHSEMEKIPFEAHRGNVYIRFAVELERYLMEGSYNKLLTSRKKVPANEYLPVVEMKWPIASRSPTHNCPFQRRSAFLWWTRRRKCAKSARSASGRYRTTKRGLFSRARRIR